MNKKDFFNQLAAKWDSEFYNDSQRVRLQEIVNLMNLKKSSTVLEIGTGTGNLIPHLLNAVGEGGFVYAVDYAKEMIARAREKFKGVKNVIFEIADAAHLPYRSEMFDYVICFGSFPHFDDKYGALKEIARVLKNRGRLFIAHALSSEEIKAHHSKSSFVADDHLPDEQRMKYFLTDAGLTLITLEDRPGLYFLEAVKK